MISNAELDRINTINHEIKPLIDFVQANPPRNCFHNLDNLQFARITNLQESDNGDYCEIRCECHDFCEELDCKLVTDKFYLRYMPIKQIFDWLDNAEYLVK